MSFGYLRKAAEWILAHPGAHFAERLTNHRLTFHVWLSRPDENRLRWEQSGTTSLPRAIPAVDCLGPMGVNHIEASSAMLHRIHRSA